MKKFLAILAVTAAALGFGMKAPLAAEGGKQKVVYHVNSDDPKIHKAALGNVQNHINAVGKENLDLRIVMHGDGLSLMASAKANEDVRAKVDNLKLQGVNFNVCANTLKGRKIDYKKDLHDVSEKDIVPSGVAEIAILQGKGFAYVKP